MTTESTLAHHLQALGEGIDAILSDYTDESILFTPNGPLHGLAAIRASFESFIKNSPPELLQAIKVLRQDVAGEVAYIVWEAKPFITRATDTFVIRNGKIVTQTYAIFA